MEKTEILNDAQARKELRKRYVKQLEEKAKSDERTMKKQPKDTIDTNALINYQFFKQGGKSVFELISEILKSSEEFRVQIAEVFNEAIMKHNIFNLMEESNFPDIEDVRDYIVSENGRLVVDLSNWKVICRGDASNKSVVAYIKQVENALQLWHVTKYDTEDDYESVTAALKDMEVPTRFYDFLKEYYYDATEVLRTFTWVEDAIIDQCDYRNRDILTMNFIDAYMSSLEKHVEEWFGSSKDELLSSSVLNHSVIELERNKRRIKEEKEATNNQVADFMKEIPGREL